MDQCRYCGREIEPEGQACADCTDYATAAMVAARVVQNSEIEHGALAASIGAEIVREYFLRSLLGARARPRPNLQADLAPLRRPLL
jgi:hypothetical protein